MEIAVVNKREEERLNILKSKILRSILGPNITRDGKIWLKLNKELEEELGGKNIVIHIKALRIVH